MFLIAYQRINISLVNQDFSANHGISKYYILTMKYWNAEALFKSFPFDLKILNLRLSSLVRSNTVNYSQSSEHYTDYYDSISRKFDDDFDEDFDDDGLFSESQNDEKQQEPIQYTVIVPMKERLLAQGILTLY